MSDQQCAYKGAGEPEGSLKVKHEGADEMFFRYVLGAVLSAAPISTCCKLATSSVRAPSTIETGVSSVSLACPSPYTLAVPMRQVVIVLPGVLPAGVSSQIRPPVAHLALPKCESRWGRSSLGHFEDCPAQIN